MDLSFLTSRHRILALLHFANHSNGEMAKRWRAEGVVFEEPLSSPSAKMAPARSAVSLHHLCMACWRQSFSPATALDFQWQEGSSGLFLSLLHLGKGTEAMDPPAVEHRGRPHLQRQCLNVRSLQRTPPPPPLSQSGAAFGFPGRSRGLSSFACAPPESSALASLWKPGSPGVFLTPPVPRPLGSQLKSARHDS